MTDHMPAPVTWECFVCGATGHTPSHNQTPHLIAHLTQKGAS